MQRLLLMQKLARHLVITSAFLKLLSDPDKPVAQQQVEDLLLSVSDSLDILLNVDN